MTRTRRALISAHTHDSIECSQLSASAPRDSLEDEHGADITQRWQLYLYFGSFSKIMLTLFEMTLANWIPPSRNLVETAGEW
eukprot:706387-Amphidinium_carterae.1